jgi:hypothetical protein
MEASNEIRPEPADNQVNDQPNTQVSDVHIFSLNFKAERRKAFCFKFKTMLHVTMIPFPFKLLTYLTLFDIRIFNPSQRSFLLFHF